MTLKKINSVCSWLLMLAFLGHLLTMTYSMLTGWYSYSLCKRLAYCTAGLTVLHIAMSLILLFFFTDGADLRRGGHLTVRTVLQRASALVIIALLHLHVQAFGFITAGTALSVSAKAGLMITEVLFFAALTTHIAVSFGNSLVSLGLVRSVRAKQLADRAASAVCLVLFGIASAALIIFVAGWTGFAG